MIFSQRLTLQHVLLGGGVGGLGLSTSCLSCVSVSTQTTCLKQTTLFQRSSCEADSSYLHFTFYERTLDAVSPPKTWRSRPASTRMQVAAIHTHVLGSSSWLLFHLKVQCVIFDWIYECYVVKSLTRCSLIHE